jgi:hypothetical protein
MRELSIALCGYVKLCEGDWIHDGVELLTYFWRHCHRYYDVLSVDVQLFELGKLLTGKEKENEICCSDMEQIIGGSQAATDRLVSGISPLFVASCT